MKAARSSNHGMALIIVMISVFVLSALAAALAYSMKVEAKLSRNADNETQLLWLGRSGVELARYVLAVQRTISAEPYDSLNQKWAGGPGGTGTSNSPIADISLDNYQVGDGSVSVKIIDLERKVNINTATPMMLNQGLTLVGVDSGQMSYISDAILDWIDPDDDPHMNGAESEYYRGLDPPYNAKNGPLDDLSELLLIRGITQDMYWGPASTNHAGAAFQQKDRFGRLVEPPSYPVGLQDIFTPFSTGRININTASATVLQMIPGVDENMANQIIQLRAGPDGVDGTDDDTPFNNPGELVNAGLNRALVQQVMAFCDVRSSTFQVTVDAKIGDSHRRFHALLGRNPGNPKDVAVLSFYWD